MSTHSRYSPSSLERIFECTASLQFIESLPLSKVDRSDSIYARRGTAGHEVSEMVLKNSVWTDGVLDELAPVDTFLGQTVEDVIIDDDILAAIIPYIKYCQKQMQKADFSKPENRLDLSGWKHLEDSIVDGGDCGGTMDFIAVYNAIVLKKKAKILEVTDLKTGAGVGVEVKDNPQLLTYALCALVEHFAGHRPTHVKITIVQVPFDHVDGHTRSQIVTPKELLNWGKDVLVPKLEEALGPDAKFNPSQTTCQWCPARGHCAARYKFSCDTALAEFADVTEIDDDGSKKQVIIMDQPKIAELSDSQRQNILEHGDEIIQFIHDIKAAAHIQAERGEEVPGFKLVRKRANRVYGSEPKVVRRELGKLGLNASDYMTPPVLLSPSKVETVMTARGISLDKSRKFLDNHVVKPESGTNLVPNHKPGIPVQGSVHTEFAHLIDEDDEDLLAL